MVRAASAGARARVPAVWAAAVRAGAIPAGAVRGALSRHRFFAAAFAAGLLLRACAELGYRWAIWFNDSFDYLAIALRPRPDPLRPIGYPLVLWLLGPLHSFAAVTALQHAMGLGAALLIYAFQIQLEQLLLADTLFMFLAVAGIVLLCWRAAAPRRIGAGGAAAAGVLLAFASLVRPVGIVLIAIALCYLAVRRAGWRVITAAGLAACAPLAGYVVWFHAATGRFALDSVDGIFLWGRVAAFADCRVIKPPPAEAWLCPRLPVSARAASSSQVWQPASPFRWRHGQEFAAAENVAALRFAVRAIAAQPGAYARTVLTGVGRSFTWNRGPYPTGYTASLYTFAGAKRWLPTWPEADGRSAAGVARAYAGAGAATVIVPPYSTVMRWYQRYFYLRGPVLAAILILPLAAGAVALRARRRRDPPRPPAPDELAGAWGAAWLTWSAALALLVVPPVTVDFDYRYVLPVVPLGCVAAALAARRLLAERFSAGWGGLPLRRPGRGQKTMAVSIPTIHELTRSDG